MRRGNLQSRALTRIEMIVIAAAAILVLTIVTAGLAHLREEARAKTCLTILSHYATAFAAYTADHNDVLPYENVGDEMLGRIVWYDALTPYFSTSQRTCPSVDRSEENARESYRMNSKLARGGTSLPTSFRRMDTLDRPEATVIIFDAKYGGRKLSLKGRLNDVDFRHSGTANLLFADWRVERFERNRLMQDSAWLPPKIVWDPDEGGTQMPEPAKPKSSRRRTARP